MKFHQLRSVLSGMALDCIRGYQVTENNYDAAWSDLKKRFDRTSELSDEYIRKFLEVPAIRHKPTHINLRAIIDATNQMLRALPGLKVVVDNWDPFLNFIIRTKLSEEIRSEWKQRQVSGKLNKTSEFLDFLENKAIEIQPIQNEKLSQIMSCDWKKKPAKKIFQIGEQEAAKKTVIGCPVCDGLHTIASCIKWKREDAKTRSDIIKRLNMCFKCLQKHKAGNCKKDNCSYCSKPHHPSLCFKKEADKRKENQPANSAVDRPVEKPELEYEEWNKSSTPKNSKK